MKPFGFLCLFLFIGTSAFMYLGYSSKGSSSLNPEGVISTGNNGVTSIMKSRKLKDYYIDHSSSNDDDGLVNLEDYRPIDPVPSSKASIRPEPIQHGTPLMPYIPKPSPPPGKPRHGG